MKKKMFFSVAAAAALLMSSPIVDKADAASNTTQTKVYYYQTGNLSNAQINSIIQKYFSNFNVQAQPVQTQPKQTTQTKQPAKVQHPAPAPAQKPAAHQPAQPAQSSYQLSAYEQKVVELTNQQRAKYGLPALKVDVQLSKAAREKSRDMQRNNYFGHNSPTYGSPFDMMKKFGITYRSAGENIAMGQRTPEEVVNSWMNSEGHRKNILNTSYTHIGLGYVAEGNYWTQLFIGR